MKPNRIPLFPLDVVLFPAMTLPLHIFESRYKIMVARCMEERIEFGIVCAEGTAVASVGCTAEILKSVKEYPDGRMDILTVGRSVYRLREVLEEKEYYEGMVEYLADDETSPRDAEKEARLIEAFQQAHAAIHGQAWSRRPPNPGAAGERTSLAYVLAPLLPLDLRERQSLLEMRAENARQDFLQRWLSESLPKLLAANRARERAGGNGHNPH
jgi:ATP-dependent Lon protease